MKFSDCHTPSPHDVFSDETLISEEYVR
jgi:hypothetical protein